MNPTPDNLPDPRTPPHRKRIHHYEVPGQARMLTFSCYLRTALLLDERWRLLLAQAISSATLHHRWLLLAFVFMPEHVHLVLAPRDGASSASALLVAIKRPTSFRVKQVLAATHDPLLSTLTIRERPGKMAFRFWQEGPGHDSNLEVADQLGNPIAYVHSNPAIRKLCDRPEQWKWSSARQYLGLDVEPGIPRVTTWSWGNGLESEGRRSAQRPLV